MISFNSLSFLVLALVLSIGKCDSGWDYLMFSQSWPATTCIDWKGSGLSHYCTLPKDKSHWNVHGLWPTANGTEGPNFCKHVELNVTELAPILDKLEEKWTNVQMPTEHYSFWKHEWQKHGSCATFDPDMDSELKYFSKGLELHEAFDVAKMLSYQNIFAGNKAYSYKELYNAVHTALNVVPEIHCVHERGTRKILLSEIRVCVNDKFNLINCVDTGDHCGTHDVTAEVIYYPLSSELGHSSSTPSPHWLYKFLYVLRLLVWFSP